MKHIFTWSIIYIFCGVFAQNRIIVNPSFETGQGCTHTGIDFLSSQGHTTPEIDGWYTTHPVYSGVQSPIEHWYTGSQGFAAQEGNYFVELNVLQSSRLYQTVFLVNGETIDYEFFHRKRVASQTETVEYSIYNQSGSTRLHLIASNTASGTGTWDRVSGTYTFNGATGVYQIGFEATSPGGGTGNFIDNVTIGLNPFTEFSSSEIYVSENDASFLPYLLMNGSVSNAETVTFNISPSNASAGVDYNITSTTLNVPASDYSLADSLSIPFSLIDNNSIDVNRYVDITINTASGDITKNDANGDGNIQTVRIYIMDDEAGIDNISACDQYSWRGNTYNSSGTYYDSLLNRYGQDSVYTLHLTINNSYLNSSVQSACDQFTWRGNTYNTSGTYYDSLTSSAGCDSVYELVLTINNSFFNSATHTACDQFTWRGNSYNSSGIYYDSLTSTAGCDSVYELHLTINNSFFNSVAQTACVQFSWRGNTYNASGTYYDSLNSVAGCDSVYELVLTINQSSTHIENITDCKTITWQGNSYNTSGTYTATFTGSNGCDSILQLNFTYQPISVNISNINSCDSIYTWGNKVYNSPGIYYDTLTTSSGCDSVIGLNLTFTTFDPLIFSVDSIIYVNSPGGNQFQWFVCKEGNITGIIGANLDSLIADAGYYKVQIFKNGCSYVSECFKHVGFIEDIGNNIEEKGLKSIINQEIELNIFQADGKLIYNQNNYLYTGTLPTVNEVRGLLIYHIKVDGHTFTLKKIN